MMTLSFGSGNFKLGKGIATFSLPAGWACPFAKKCKSKYDSKHCKIIDGKDTKFRCYAAIQERFPAVRNSRWNNFNQLKELGLNKGEMVNLILSSLPNSKVIRLHVSGDFFNESYFQAWIEVASRAPDTLFYGYTKAIPFLVKYKNSIPNNLKLVASYGGTHDSLIKSHNLRFAKVVFSQESAQRNHLEIDHDDSLAMGGLSFGLLLHGVQPAGSAAAIAWEEVKKEIGGYSPKRKQNASS